MSISDRERDVLRRLAGEVAEIAALPVQAEKADLWRRLNDLDTGVRPLVWINEICWDQMDADGELSCDCEDPWARRQELTLRLQLYQWRHLPGDMVVSDTIPCRKAYDSTSMEIESQTTEADSDGVESIVSHHFIPQGKRLEDVERIRMPVVTADPEATEQEYQKLCDIFDGVMPVRLEGDKANWFAPWDLLITIWGVQEAMIDLVDRPEVINAFVSRIVDCNVSFLEQKEELGLIDVNNTNNRVGSGGYGYTGDLPSDGFDPERIRLKDQWGCATAQIFSEVSPEMHWEFALRHEMRILEKFGLTYYGCCEPLDIKMDILRRVPNLRKISMSPWVDPVRAAELLGGEYVYSLKPNPAILAEDTWRPEQARAELRDTLEKVCGCNVEIILKDISTVRHEPQRLWEWAEMAMEEAGRMG